MLHSVTTPASLGACNVFAPQRRPSRQRRVANLEIRALKFDTSLPPIPTEFPPLPTPSLPPFKKVRGKLLIKAGSRIESPDQLGIASITASSSRTGGTRSYPQGKLDEAVDSRAAVLEAGSSTSVLSAQFGCLPEDAPFVLPLLRDVLLRPLLPSSVIEFNKNLVLGAIARRNDSAASIAARETLPLLYGKESPFARVPTAETVQGITRRDARDFAEFSTCCPKDAVLAIWGAFDPQDMASLATDTFSGWGGNPAGRRAGAARFPPIREEGVAAAAPGIYLVDRPGLTQGYVRMGELGTNVRDSSTYSLDVLNSILNGFGGRLFDQVRSQQSLAYSVSGGWSPGLDHRGAFIAGGETQAALVGRFIRAVQAVLRRTTEEPPTQEELSRAKKASLNSFIFNFADTGAQLSRIATYDLFGLRQDFLFQFKRRVEAVTAEDVLAAAQEHLHLRQQPILVVADAAAVMGQLEELDMPITLVTPQ